MKKVKLGEIATYINGYAFKPTDWTDVGLPIIRIQDLTGTSYQTNRFNGVVAEKYLISNGDVLISWSASLGVYVWKGEKAVLNQHIFKVVFDKVKVNKKFFIYQVESVLKKATGDVHGATMKHLTKPVFDSLPFVLPSLEKQKEIADRLDKISSLIEKRKEQLAKLDQLIKSRFIELFGHLEENSKNWGIKSFSEFAVIDTNMTNDFDTYADYPHIGIDSIEKNTGVLSGYRTIKEDNVISGKYLFTPEHIIYSKIRPNLNKVALPDFYGLCSADAYPILVRENCNRVFLAVLMRSDFFLKHVLSLCGRANQPKVNKEQVQAFKSPFPPIELQNEFAEFVKLIDKSKFAVQKSIEKLEILKKSLMQQYFG